MVVCLQLVLIEVKRLFGIAFKVALVSTTTASLKGTRVQASPEGDMYRKFNGPWGINTREYHLYSPLRRITKISSKSSVLFTEPILFFTMSGRRGNDPLMFLRKLLKKDEDGDAAKVQR